MSNERGVEPVVAAYRGTAAELHAVPMPTDGGAQIWTMEPTGAALVHGSTQKPEDFVAVDGLELSGRRSGGGAVFIEPASVVWVDVLAPRGSSLWSDDLTMTFVLVGRVWRRALEACGLATDVVEADGRTDEAARVACWAGHGWGELVVEGRKVVGLSQRRTRWGARIQTMAVFDDSVVRVGDHLPPSALRDQVRARLGAAPTFTPDLVRLRSSIVEELRSAFDATT